MSRKQKYTKKNIKARKVHSIKHAPPVKTPVPAKAGDLVLFIHHDE